VHVPDHKLNKRYGINVGKTATHILTVAKFAVV